MNVLIAMDSFKGSLSSLEAGNAVREAVLSLDKNAAVSVFPLADGGEGTVDALATGMNGRIIQIQVTGPLGTPVVARYCILPDHTAVIEMAAAAGLTLVPPEKRDPMVTTTYGVGEVIRDALDRGCRNFIVGIGGSATNDGGTGMLSALGFAFLDREGAPVPPGAAGLAGLATIQRENADPRLGQCNFRVACDVTNPLCGPQGCSAVFAPQKGADPEAIVQMDRWLQNYAELSGGDGQTPGAGAAGGLGFAFVRFLGATLEPGIRIVLEQTGIPTAIESADVVVTGEGRLDGQTVMGKAPIGVASLAKACQKPVIAFCGCVGKDAALCNDHGIDAYFSVVPGVLTEQEAMEPETARKNLYNTATQAFRLLMLGERM